MENVSGFANEQFAEDIKADLEETDDSKRKLTEIDEVSA